MLIWMLEWGVGVWFHFHVELKKCQPKQQSERPKINFTTNQVTNAVYIYSFIIIY